MSESLPPTLSPHLLNFNPSHGSCDPIPNDTIPYMVFCYLTHNSNTLHTVDSLIFATWKFASWVRLCWRSFNFTSVTWIWHSVFIYKCYSLCLIFSIEEHV